MSFRDSLLCWMEAGSTDWLYQSAPEFHQQASSSSSNDAVAAADDDDDVCLLLPRLLAALQAFFSRRQQASKQCQEDNSLPLFLLKLKKKFFGKEGRRFCEYLGEWGLERKSC